MKDDKRGGTSEVQSHSLAVCACACMCAQGSKIRGVYIWAEDIIQAAAYLHRTFPISI